MVNNLKILDKSPLDSEKGKLQENYEYLGLESWTPAERATAQLRETAHYPLDHLTPPQKKKKLQFPGLQID